MGPSDQPQHLQSEAIQEGYEDGPLNPAFGIDRDHPLQVGQLSTPTAQYILNAYLHAIRQLAQILPKGENPVIS